MSEPISREPLTPTRLPPGERGGREGPSADEKAPVAPWQQVAPGRYMPRRTRGSCLGRELG
jgi:hypothetical protein